MNAPEWDSETHPTFAMRRRHRERVREMAAAVWQTWEDAGEVAANPRTAKAAIERVKDEYAVASRPAWMHPLDAIATLVAFSVDGDELIPERQRVDHLDALRTKEGMTVGAWAAWVAYSCGTGTRHLVDTYMPNEKPRAPMRLGRTALYRHFDAGGTLLYIGITVDLEQRVRGHEQTSDWLALSARCEVEWFDTRREAEGAEREAIRTEQPLFNRRDSVVDEALPVAYLAKFRPNP